MGFPCGYTEVVLLPKLLITTLSIFTLITKLLLQSLGLSDFTESDMAQSDWARHKPAQSMSAVLIQEMLPATHYRPGLGPDLLDQDCAICLYKFQEDDEIRRLRNCPHVFHRSCVDRWIDLDRRTCPLCRMCLVPLELKDDFNDKLWAATGITDFLL